MTTDNKKATHHAQQALMLIAKLRQQTGDNYVQTKRKKVCG